MVVVFGDAEAAVVDILSGDAGLAAFANVTVSTDLVGYSAGLSWVKVSRTGGIPTLWMRLDNALIAFDVRAANKGLAFDIAETARAAVFEARGIYVGRGMDLYDAVDTTGLTWSPDERQPEIPRYEFTLSLVTRPS